ncbi:MAG: stage V sporulation protein AC [Clostridia bacterium]|nr:stage V sporulation protein AC [Clostridia bacterium]
MTNKEYQKYVDKMTPNSPLAKDILLAFLFGGTICTIGQVIFNWYSTLELTKTITSMLTSSTMVFIGAFLTGIGVYDRLAKYAGAGTIVPITGFANAVASPAIEFKSEGMVLGLAVKMFTVAGPVVVYGITSGFVAGIIYYVMSFF